MVLKQRFLKTAVALSLTASAIAPACAFAATPAPSAVIEETASTDAAQAESAALSEKIDSLSKELDSMKARKDLQKDDYEARRAISDIASELAELRSQQESLSKLVNTIATGKAEREYAGVSSTNYLVNPGPSGHMSYTQDAINSQGKSTMVFRYAPNQIYKIYCRPGYLTDLAFHQGEKITFVGGGDTSAWAINTTNVAGTPHLYIKPTVESSITNLIVTTNKRSYQIIVNTSNWYNPMVTWSYEDEDLQSRIGALGAQEASVTDTMNATSLSSLNFNYKIKGNKKLAPDMVLDDGTKTVLKYNNGLPKKGPAIFTKESKRGNVNLVNYRVKDNCYIIDRVLQDAELHFSDDKGDIVSIHRVNP